jgi:hypothetical protein
VIPRYGFCAIERGDDVPVKAKAKDEFEKCFEHGILSEIGLCRMVHAQEMTASVVGPRVLPRILRILTLFGCPFYQSCGSVVRL